MDGFSIKTEGRRHRCARMGQCAARTPAWGLSRMIDNPRRILLVRKLPHGEADAAEGSLAAI